MEGDECIGVTIDCSSIEVNGKTIFIPIDTAVAIAATVAQGMAAILTLAKQFNPKVEVAGEDAIPLIDVLIPRDNV